MKRLLNFAPPLSDETHRRIEELMGEFEEIRVPCQLDLSGDGQSLAGQVADMEADAEIRLQHADMVIAPALSSAAFILARDHLPMPNWLAVRIVWLKREGNPPEFVLGGIE